VCQGPILMQRQSSFVEDHLAAGYASDDCRPAPLPYGYGNLPGDRPVRRKLSKEELLDYQIRQQSAGPPGKRIRYLDALLGRHQQYQQQRLSPAQTRPRTTLERHKQLLQWLPHKRLAEGSAFKNDLQLLRESHRFLRTEEDDDGSWEAGLAQRYYARLFREYVICDLAGYRKGQVGFRWRTEAEVVRGRGQLSCGHKPCESKLGLRSYEVDFKYVEAGDKKRALVKVRLCEACAFKLHYRRIKAARKRQRRSEKCSRKRTKTEEMPSDAVDVEASSHSDCSEAAGNAAYNDVHADVEGSRADEGADVQPNATDKRLLESLAWKGPDPDARTREDDFDDYFRDLFA